MRYVFGATLIIVVVFVANHWRSSSPVTGVTSSDAVSVIHVREAAQDLGRIQLTTLPLEFHYLVENWGLGNLKILGMQASCGCTQPQLSRTEIPPGESTDVLLRILPDAAGEKSVSVTLLTNDPAQRRLTLSASWNGDAGIEVEPSRVDFGSLRPGDSVDRQLLLKKNAGRVVGVSCEPDCVTALLSESQVQVTLVAASHPSIGQGVIRLKIDGGFPDHLAIPVSWSIRQPVQASPATLFLGSGHPGERLKGTVVLRGKDEKLVEIDSCEWIESFSGAKVNIDKEQGRVQVDWTAPESAGLSRGILLIRVKGHEVRVPVSGLVIKSRYKSI